MVHDPASSSGNTFEVDQPEGNLFSVVPEDPNFNTIPYPYLQYTDGADGEVHVRAFLTTWQANDVLQQFGRGQWRNIGDHRVRLVSLWASSALVLTTRLGGVCTL